MWQSFSDSNPFDTSFVTLLLLAAAVVALKILFTGRPSYKSSSSFSTTGSGRDVEVILRKFLF